MSRGTLGSFVRSSGGGYNFIHFSSVQDPKLVASFDPFDLEIANTFNSNWNKEAVFGRMDSIPAFQGVERSISISWNIVMTGARGDVESKISSLNKLHQMLYPGYLARAEGSNLGTVRSTTISTAPLIRIRLPNMVARAYGLGTGLLGFIDGGLSTSPSVNEGFLHVGQMVVPKEQRVTLTFYVLHEHFVGFGHAGEDTRSETFKNFPFPLRNPTKLGPGGEKERFEDREIEPSNASDGFVDLEGTVKEASSDIVDGSLESQNQLRQEKRSLGGNSSLRQVIGVEDRPTFFPDERNKLEQLHQRLDEIDTDKIVF